MSAPFDGVVTRRAALLLAAMWLAPVRPPLQSTTVHLIGDSTMADKPSPERNPERGWGQALPPLLRDDVRVRNHAVNGRSTKSFLDEGRWARVLGELQAGDVVLIQFGHNDEKVADPTRYAAADGAYRENLERFVRETRAAGATPVLCTPIVRRDFGADGRLRPTHGAYPGVVRALAAELAVDLLDLEALTSRMVEAAGAEGSKRLYVWTRAGEFVDYPQARSDDTHLSPAGALAVAKLAVAELAVAESAGADRTAADRRAPTASRLRGLVRPSGGR